MCIFLDADIPLRNGALVNDNSPRQKRYRTEQTGNDYHCTEHALAVGSADKKAPDLHPVLFAIRSNQGSTSSIAMVAGIS